MKSAPKPWLKPTLITAGTVGFLYLTLTLLTPAWGKIVGFADAQPPLRIIQPADGQPQVELRKIVATAQYLYDSRPGLESLYWAAPAMIEEKADCWVVTYASKTPIYRFLGFSVTVKPTTPAMAISIAKHDYSARFGNWCQ